YYTPEQLTSSERSMPISIMAWGGESEEMLKKVVLSCANLDLGIDTLWIDAGWYADVVPESNGIAAAADWKYHVGTWTYNKALYPNGNMADLGMTCEENDIDMLQWFEIERAYAGSENTLMHPELYYEYTQNNNYLLRLDTQEGYDYMYNYLATQIETNKIDIYRQDFNMQPINYWLSQDDEGRTGITETYYITNLYRLFDELSAAFPDLLIDNCASGGRRLDIEMTKRSVPLFRTDYTTNKNYASSEMLQAQTQSISYWLPLTGTGFGQSNVKTFNDYTMMSHISPAVSLPNSFDNPSLYKSCASIYSQSQPYWTGDLYNLTDVSYSASSNQAYELFRPDMNSGMAIIYIR
ncbi:MAG: alpha-galactosidase, partial [Lachnospiraceae bacterium]